MNKKLSNKKGPFCPVTINSFKLWNSSYYNFLWHCIDQWCNIYQGSHDSITCLIFRKPTFSELLTLSLEIIMLESNLNWTKMCQILKYLIPYFKTFPMQRDLKKKLQWVSKKIIKCWSSIGYFKSRDKIIYIWLREHCEWSTLRNLVTLAGVNVGKGTCFAVGRSES